MTLLCTMYYDRIIKCLPSTWTLLKIKWTTVYVVDMNRTLTMKNWTFLIQGMRRNRSFEWRKIWRSERKSADLAQSEREKEDIILARNQLSQFGIFPYILFHDYHWNVFWIKFVISRFSSSESPISFFDVNVWWLKLENHSDNGCRWTDI